MTEVAVKHITKSFAGKTVLDDIDLHIEDGEFVSLLGPSGCGKTTLLRIIAGLQDCDSGSLEFDGKNMADVPARERRIGMVFQQYSLFPNMTVRKNIAFPLQVDGMKKAAIAERVDEMLELVGLEEHQHKHPKQLSGGQQQRVALARALAPRPQILLLDEPLSALDARVRNRLRDQIRAIQQEVGITTIFVTHDQSEAFVMSDRVALMGGGGVLQFAKPSEIYVAPSTVEGSQFIGSRNEVEVTARGGRLEWNGIFDLPTDLRDGETAVCSFRSESVDIDLVDDAGASRATGIVKSRAYYGATSALELAVDPFGEPLRADVSGAKAVRIKNESHVAIAVDPANINVYVGGILQQQKNASVAVNS